jgi:hypothetical protein
MFLSGGFLALAAGAQTWTKSDALNFYWTGIAASADGMKMVACPLYGTNSPSFPGPICLSTNGGTNWMINTATTNSWYGVCSSTNGVKLSAIVENGNPNNNTNLYTSTNSGATWQPQAMPMSPRAIACSGDGSRLLVAGATSNRVDVVYTSPDQGATWISNSIPTNEFWYAVASSLNGSNLIAAANGDYTDTNPGVIYTSTNGGNLWVSNSLPQAFWNTVASSGDGSELLAGARASTVYLSTNGGKNWTSAELFGFFTGSAISGDGTWMLAAANDYIYSSYDSGGTWGSNNAPSQAWELVAAALDGTRAAAISSGGIYYVASASAPTITPKGTNALLTWPWPSTGFGLQMNTNLATANWTALTNIPLVTNWQNQVTLPHTNSAAYFRLTGP